MRFLLLTCLALCIGCGNTNKTSNLAEVVSVAIDGDKIPIYCHTSFKKDAFDLYFISNAYTINLPQGWKLEMNREEQLYYNHLRQKDSTFSYEIACDNYPGKFYRNFTIRNEKGDKVQTVRLPVYTVKEENP